MLSVLLCILCTPQAWKEGHMGHTVGKNVQSAWSLPKVQLVHYILWTVIHLISIVVLLYADTGITSQ